MAQMQTKLALSDQVKFLHPPFYPTGKERKARIALAQMTADGWIETIHRLPELLEILQQHQLEGNMVDLFLSINAFTQSRRMDNLAELLGLFVDIDCYQLRLFPEMVKDDILALVPHKIPQPNIIVYSGRGAWAIWLLRETPKGAVPIWIALQKYFCESLEHLGVDKKAKDVARVMRVPQSIHGLTGAQVEWDVLHNQRYRLDQLQQQYLLKPKSRAPQRSKPRQQTPIHPKFFSLYTLHCAIIDDLKRLADLRGRELEGCREYFLFIWRNCLVRLDQSVEESEHELRSVALDFLSDDQLPDREWERTTMSAHRAKHKTKNGTEEPGYQLSVGWIIEKLGVTVDEQQKMQVLIGRPEKYRRKNEKRYRRRRADYLASFEEKRRLVVELRQKCPDATFQELAKMANVSFMTVRRVVKSSF